MRKVIASINVTLDGFMAGPNNELDWHFPLWNEEMSKYARQQLCTMDVILLGRITYQAMAAYWPYASPDDFAFMMNNKAKIVFSRSLQKADWNNSKIISRNIKQEILKLKQQPGNNMIIYGSNSIVSTFIKLDLIDEYRIWVHPVAIGGGSPLFKNLKNKVDLLLIRTKIFSSGIALLYYQPVKKIKPICINEYI